MKKIIVITAVGLLLGMGGAVGIVVAREKQARAAAPRPAADSTAMHADSTDRTEHGDSLPVDTAHADSARADSAFSDSAYAAAHGPIDSIAIPRPTEGPGSLAAEVAEASQPLGPGEERLARIFAAMRPEEAARVLEQMSDREVRRLLSHLRERQAAAIMSSISPERAAVISSAVIRGERSSP